MFDSALNATLLPSPIPRESVLALWRTPEELAEHVPAWSVRGHSSPDPASPEASMHRIEVVLPGAAGSTISVPCHVTPLWSSLDALVSVGTRSPDASRSAKAWAHIARCALRLAARGRLQPTIAADATDLWVPGPLEADDVDLLRRLGEWMPPEAFCAFLSDSAGGDSAVAASGSVAAPSSEEAVRSMYDCVIDSIPRSPAMAAFSGSTAWARMERTDVSVARDRIQGAMVRRRSIIQLRLELPPTPEEPSSLHLFVRAQSHAFQAVAAADLWSGLEHFDPQLEHDLLFLLRRAGYVWAPLARLLEQPAPTRINLEAGEVEELLGPVAAELSATGIELMVPTELLREVRAAPQITVAETDFHSGSGDSGSGDSGSGMFGFDSLCDVTWSMQVAGKDLTSEEIESLIDSKRRLVRLDDGWILVDERVIKKLRTRQEFGATRALGEALSFADLSSTDIGDLPPAAGARGETANQAPVGYLVDPRIRSFVRGIAAAAADEDFPAPVALNGELRPYQRAGLAWMSALIDSRFGGILADDMGLGKTMQVIATHLWINAEGLHTNGRFGPTLVVAPAGLLHNWSVELERWAPSCQVHHFHGPERSLKDISVGDVVLTTYGIVRREADLLAERKWGLVVADEAQAMKNHLSATARTMRRIPSQVRFALTGTPVENHLGELWSILEWTTPGLLGPLQQFERNTATPIERDGDSAAEARLNRVVAPFMLRRLKSDPRIVPELPPRTITDHVVPATTEQAALYKAVSSEILESVRSSTGIARRGAIFKLLTALKQVANHPAHYLREDGPLPERSGKFDLVREMVGEIVESGQSVVLFTQYVQMAKLLVEGLAVPGFRPEMLHGGASLKDRTAMVERFQSRDTRTLVVSLRAGGVGLNLTAATHVIHYDRWWNPAVENQASDRVWRIGQTQPVQVHRLITEGTLEEKIAMLLESKQQLAERVLDSNTWITEMSDDELSDLVTLGGSSLVDPSLSKPKPSESSSPETSPQEAPSPEAPSSQSSPIAGEMDG